MRPAMLVLFCHQNAHFLNTLQLYIHNPHPAPPPSCVFYSLAPMDTFHLPQLNMRLFIFPLIFSTLFSASMLDAHFTGAVEQKERENPFSPKASLCRYWRKSVTSNQSIPQFLLSKASPLTATQSATYAKLVVENKTSHHLLSFCSAANLLCFPILSQTPENHSNTDFIRYGNRNFTNYNPGRFNRSDSFTSYSPDINLPVDSFSRYGNKAKNYALEFKEYAIDANVADQRFKTYSNQASIGTGDFKNYSVQANVLYLQFTSISEDAASFNNSFNGYGKEANSGDQSFNSYGKKGSNISNAFSGYGENTNTVGSSFLNYGEHGRFSNDTFSSYGDNGNAPQNIFSAYSFGGISHSTSFSNYRNQSNVGTDTFISYGKRSVANKIDFGNYGNSFNNGSDVFFSYRTGTTEPVSVDFNSYRGNNTFAGYDKQSFKITLFRNSSSAHGSLKNSAWIEPGKFFREDKLSAGVVMLMPDVRDKTPRRSFLPRSILDKLPNSTTEIKTVFGVDSNSAMAKIIVDANRECEREASPGETKKCVASAEDLIDFVISLLGCNVEAHAMENVNGSTHAILIGRVRGINGGKVTKSVSCHQTLFPYLLFYCHSVPKVRVYQAEILDPKTRLKINHGVAICHLDTSAWSHNHAAFLALGSGPGRIEACHWIFENDVTWTVADSS